MNPYNIVYYPRLFWSSATTGVLLIIFALYRMQHAYQQSMQTQPQPFMAEQINNAQTIDGFLTYTIFFVGVLILIGLAIADRKQVKDNHSLMIRP